MSLKIDAQFILRDQLQKVSTFLFILIFLFVIFVIFKLNYSWEGMTEITNAYLFFLSFYIIYNFSRIDLEQYKKQFKNNSGKWGVFNLFIISRIIPFLFIYSATAIFTLIKYLDSPDWPLKPILNLLNGRFSNIVFYSLILLVILRIRKDPRISIAVFFILSVFYFIIYSLFWVYFENGVIVTFLKIIQITFASFFLINEFYFDKSRKFKSAAVAVVAGVIFYFFLLGVHVTVFYLSSFGSYSQVKTGLDLLERGHRFPLARIQEIVINNGRTDLVDEIIYYATLYRRDIGLSGDAWGDILKKSDLRIAGAICGYLAEKNIALPDDDVILFALQKSETAGKKLIDSKKFISYASKYTDPEKVLEAFARSDRNYKIWALRVVSQSKARKCIPFLISIVTEMDKEISGEAYHALTVITGEDPVKDLGLSIYSPVALKAFTEMYPYTGTSF